MRNGLATTTNSDAVTVKYVPLISRKIGARAGLGLVGCAVRPRVHVLGQLGPCSPHVVGIAFPP
jgi:hypothetical protein